MLIGMLGRPFEPFLEGDGGTGGGGGGTSEEDKILRAMQSLMSKHGGADQALRVVLDENHDYRTKNARLNTELTDLKKKVEDGGRILTKDEAAELDAYRALGVKPDEAKQALAERTELAGRVARSERDALLQQVADASGYKLAPLKRLAVKDDGSPVEFVVKEEEQDGSKVPVAYVKDGNDLKPIQDFANSAWSEFLPALQAKTEDNGGIRFPGQVRTGGTGSNNSDPLALYNQATYLRDQKK